ncbi:MAG: YvcK family protein [Anaerolineales bacterium]|nr:YvcK family protein [Anaerolineales bacterium]
MKRWLILMLVGVTLLGVGLAFVLVEIYHGGYLPPYLDILTLQTIPRPLRAVGLGAAGVAAATYAVVRLSKMVLEPLAPSGRSVAAAVVERRRKQRGPRVVAIGGGTGLAVLLRGLKEHTSNIAAIVTVADDGGSSGRLRRELGVPPPGDLRNCMAALADDEALLTQLFQYRFGAGNGVEGHSFGNLFISAMTGVTGSFETALAVSSQVLAIGGRVLPATLENVSLTADVRESIHGRAQRVTGESAIPDDMGVIEHVHLQPQEAAAYPQAVQAILGADLIIAGPGSLFTSVLPNLLVPDIAAAIRSSRALCIYVCNVATQKGETDGFSVWEHVQNLHTHTDGTMFPIVLANNRWQGALLPGMEWVTSGNHINGVGEVVAADVVDEKSPWRHDSGKLAAALLRLLKHGGPAPML